MGKAGQGRAGQNRDSPGAWEGAVGVAQPGWEQRGSFHLTFLVFVLPGDISFSSSGEVSTSELEQCLQKEMGQEANSF